MSNEKIYIPLPEFYKHIYFIERDGVRYYNSNYEGECLQVEGGSDHA